MSILNPRKYLGENDMRIFRNLDELNLSNKPLTVALGNFDGVHLGHQKLINIAKNISLNLNGETLVFTFYPHPNFVLNKNIEILNYFEFKTKLIEKLEVESFLAIPFTEQIAKLAPDEFVQEILFKKLKAVHLVAGFNYSFGYKGEGKAKDLVQLAGDLGIKTTIMEPFYVDNELVSSSKIRQYLKLGQIRNASKLLGYSPRIKGRVIHGNKIGRKLGFPTANLDWDKNLLIPNAGVYAVEVLVHNKLELGILNIGFKPTVTDEKKLTIEVNIFNFFHDIYNCDIEIIFHEKLRGEKKFNNLAELKNQINIDVLSAKNYFSKYL